MDNGVLYTMLTTNCNLQCPHCELRKLVDRYDPNKLKEVVNRFNGQIVLFGGEPTLYKDRLRDMLYSDAIKGHPITISTNLVYLDDDILQMLKDIKSIGTSWNPHRFNEDQYQSWLKNLQILKENGLFVTVLITLTDDLFEINPNKFMKMVNTEWDKDVVKSIKFEHLVAPTTDPPYYERADNWLSELYSVWTPDIHNDTEDRVRYWYLDCDNVYTVRPDGTLLKGCPNYSVYHMPVECYSCERADICRPCRLQPYCSYPKKFGAKVMEHQDNVEVLNNERKCID